MKNLFNILKLLTKEQKKTSFVILLAMMLSALLEVAGVSLIIPLIYFMAEPNSINEYPKILLNLKEIFSFLDIKKLNFLSLNEAIVVLMIASISILFLIKNIILILIQWMQATYVAKLSYRWQNELYKGYLRSSYKFYFNRSASDLLHNINQTSVLSTGINSTLLLLTDSILVLSLVSFLIYLQPVESVAIFILFFFSTYLLFVLIKKKIEEIGRKSHLYEGQRQKLVLDSFSGIREIKLNDKTGMFLNIFDKVNWLSLKMGVYKNVISAIPRFWLEITFLVSLNVIILIIFYSNNSITFSLPIIGIFAAAAFRIMPSVGRIMVNLNILKTNLPVSEIVKNEIQNLEKTTDLVSKDLDFKESICLKNIQFSYNTNDLEVLKNINIMIPKGSIIGISGNSGSGKSTLLDLLIGLIIPDKGEILIDSRPVKDNIKSWQKKIGYVSQDIFLINESFSKNISYEIEEDKINYEKIKKIIKILGLDDFINNLPENLKSHVGERGIKMSGGQLKRIGIARALYKTPEMLILDETFSSLDIETEKNIMSEIKSFDKNLSIVIVSHRQSTLELCDKVYKLENGEIVTNYEK